MKNKKVKQINNKPISPKELKYWLAGILEFQTDKWVPNIDQWETIKTKIFNLIETEIQSNSNKDTIVHSINTNDIPTINKNIPELGGVAPNASLMFPSISEEEIRRSIDDIKNNDMLNHKISSASIKAGKSFE